MTLPVRKYSAANSRFPGEAVAVRDVHRVPRALPEEELHEDARVVLRHLEEATHHVRRERDQLLRMRERKQSQNVRSSLSRTAKRQSPQEKWGYFFVAFKVFVHLERSSFPNRIRHHFLEDSE